MKKQVMTVLALGIGAVALTNTSSSAQASGWGTDIRGDGLVLQVGHKHKHGHNGGIYFSFGGNGHYDNGYHGENCRYFKRKARVTGRRYWWKKYRRCMYRNGY